MHARQLSFFGEPDEVVIERRQAIPPRIMFRNAPREVPEIEGDRFRRVCPICYKSLFWRVWDKCLRIDEAKSDDPDAMLIPEYGPTFYGIPRYGEYWEPWCSVHKRCDNWLIFDDGKALLVGRANIDEGGGLFRFPMATTRRAEARMLIGRPCPFGRPKGSRNKTKSAAVGTGVQGWIKTGGKS